MQGRRQIGLFQLPIAGRLAINSLLDRGGDVARLSPYLAFAMACSCVALLGTALYMEFVSGLVPCALCLAQRGMFALIAVACLLYLIPAYRLRLICAFTSLLGALLGIWLASRQLWLQSLPPDQVPDCGPDIYFMIERFPFAQSLETLLLGSGSCAEVQWTFLNLSIPGWTLLWFIALALGSVWLGAARGARPFRLFND